MSDTPRTDESLEEHAYDDRHAPHTDWVPAHFARTLELELATLRDQLEATQVSVRPLIKENVELRSELERLQDVVGEEDFEIIQKLLARQG
jgi:hypothetical protein